MFSVAWKSSSNIAFVKYWGKRAGQLPANPNLSMSLAEAYTKTRVLASEPGPGIPVFTVNGRTDHPFLEKIQQLYGKMKADFPVLEKFIFQVETANSFPHSTGIASSASGLSAFALCMLELAYQAEGKDLHPEGFMQQASFYARMGSGSACRSLYGGFTVWGKTAKVEESSDDYAISISDKIHPDFLDLHDTILLISSEPKSLSSTAGHAKMDAHPFAEARRLQAAGNLENIIISLEKGDFDSFGKICESEALTLHSLIMTDDNSTILLEPDSLKVILAVKNARKQGFPIFFTIDAGPNIHLLYPGSQANRIKNFIQQELLRFCEGNKVIYDECGQGPIRISPQQSFNS